MIFHFRALMLCKSMENPAEILEKNEDSISKYQEQAAKFNLERLIYIIQILGEYLLQSKRLSTPKVAVEMAIVLICAKENNKDTEELALRIEKLEKGMEELKANGITVRKASGKISAVKPSAGDDTPKPSMPHIDEGKMWTKWREALELIKNKSKSLYTYLFNAKALFYGDEVELVIASDLAYEKINTHDGRTYLAELFSEIQGSSLKVTVSGKEGPRQRSDKGASVLDIAAKKDLLGEKMTVVD
jgi:DNA polymerase-3 subunit gamma/tau